MTDHDAPVVADEAVLPQNSAEDDPWAELADQVAGLECPWHAVPQQEGAEPEHGVASRPQGYAVATNGERRSPKAAGEPSSASAPSQVASGKGIGSEPGEL